MVQRRFVPAAVCRNLDNSPEKEAQLALLKLENVMSDPVEEGDAGIILKRDGSFRIFNCSSQIDGGELTEEQVQQGTRLLALSAALRSPEIMAVLTELSNDKTIFGDKTIDFGRMN